MIDSLSPLGVVSASPTPTTTSATRAAADGVSFEQALGQTFGAAVDTLKTGEAAAIQGVVGAAPPMRVVESVMDAQRALQSVLAVRDKLVSAWQEISRMSI